MNKFKDIDKKSKYKFRDQRLQAAKESGFEYISEHIVMTYRSGLSLRKTGEICGNVSPIAISNILNICDEPIREQGGRVWSKLTQADIDDIRSQPYMNSRLYKKFAKEISERESKRLKKEVSINPLTIKNVWTRRTHN